MELRERLMGGRPSAPEAPDRFAEVKDRVHLAVISELGPQLYNATIDDDALHRAVVADIRSRLAGEPRHYAQLTGPVESFASLIPVEKGITYSALLLAAAQLVFLFNLAWSARRGARAGENPWHATTLEWSPIAHPIIESGPYEYGPDTGPKGDFTPQWEPQEILGNESGPC